MLRDSEETKPLSPIVGETLSLPLRYYLEAIQSELPTESLRIGTRRRLSIPTEWAQVSTIRLETAECPHCHSTRGTEPLYVIALGKSNFIIFALRLIGACVMLLTRGRIQPFASHLTNF
jgi:hypothetical protein